MYDMIILKRIHPFQNNKTWQYYIGNTLKISNNIALENDKCQLLWHIVNILRQKEKKNT